MGIFGRDFFLKKSSSSSPSSRSGLIFVVFLAFVAGAGFGYFFLIKKSSPSSSSLKRFPFLAGGFVSTLAGDGFCYSFLAGDGFCSSLLAAGMGNALLYFGFVAAGNGSDLISLL